MTGMDARTGKPLTGPAHLRQSIADVLTTPVGSRVGRRDYGSLLPRLLDQPLNAALRIRIFAATVGALARWEPRLAVTRVQLDRASGGAVSLSIEGRDREAALPALATIIVPLAGATA